MNILSSKNAERYADPTPHLASINIERKKIQAVEVGGVYHYPASNGADRLFLVIARNEAVASGMVVNDSSEHEAVEIMPGKYVHIHMVSFTFIEKLGNLEFSVPESSVNKIRRELGRYMGIVQPCYDSIASEPVATGTNVGSKDTEPHWISVLDELPPPPQSGSCFGRHAAAVSGSSVFRSCYRNF